MPSKDKITKEIYLDCKVMLSKLLGMTLYLGVGYVLQLLYELAVVITAYEHGSDIAVDKYLRESMDSFRTLVIARNVVNHNSYDKTRVVCVVKDVIDFHVVEKLYLQIFGEAKDYKVFEAECYVYLEYMKRLWR